MIHVLLPLLLAVRVAMPTITASPGATVTSPSTITVTGVSRSTGSVTYCADGAAPRRVASQRGPLTVSSVGSHTIACRSYTLDGREASRTASLIVTVSAATEPVVSAASCETAPVRSTGQVYYFCDCTQADVDANRCVRGNDANSGTTPGTARQSLTGNGSRSADYVFNTMSAGGTVALCRGGTWTSGINLNNPNCRGTDGDPAHVAFWPAPDANTYTCDLRDYPTALSTAKPVIAVAGASALWAGSSGAYREGYRIWNLDVRGNNTGTYMGPYGFGQNGNKISYLDFCGDRFYEWGQGISIDSRDATDWGSYITVRGSYFERNRGHAFGGVSHYMKLDGNTFVNDGDYNEVAGNDGWEHELYVVCSHDNGPPCHGIEITNNYFRADPPGPAWPAGGGCGGVRTVIRGVQYGTIFENNFIDISGPFGPGCVGIATTWNNNYAELHDVLIRRNRVRMNTTDAAIGIEVNCCKNCQVTDNIVDMSTTVTGSDKGGIVSPAWAWVTSPTHGGTGEQSHVCAYTTGTVIRNNTVLVRNGGSGHGIRAGLRSWDSGWSTEGSDFVVENNAVWFYPITPSTEGGCFYWTDSKMASGHSFSQTLYPSTAINTAGNYCVNNGAAASVIWVDPLNGDFRPLLGGPLIGTANQTYYSPVAADPAWSATGTGVPRTPPNPPVDIGAMVR